MMKTIFNTFAISLISFTISAQKIGGCKYWLSTFQDYKATMVFANESQSYFVVNQNRKYEIKKMKVLADSSIIFNDVEGLKLISLSADSLEIKASSEPSIKFHCLNDEVIRNKLDLLISFGSKYIESFNSDSLFLVDNDNQPVFIDFKGIKVASFEKVLPMDSTGFWVKQQDGWKLLDTHFKINTAISGNFSEVIQNSISDFAIAQHDTNDRETTNIKLKKNKWGYIHDSLYIHPQYDKVLYYGHGLLPVLTKNKRWIFLDTQKGTNSYPKLSFTKKPTFKMSYWLAETPSEIFEIKENYYRHFKKSELKSKSKK